MKRHLSDPHMLRTAQTVQTRCGKLREPPVDTAHGVNGTYLKNFDEVVDDEPIPGEDYCRNCMRDYEREQK